jgi:hypothetical protein
MLDWVAIIAACVLVAVAGLGFVLWERHEGETLARERPRRRLPRGDARRRPASDVDRRAA